MTENFLCSAIHAFSFFIAGILSGFLAPVPWIAADNPSSSVLGNPIGQGDGAQTGVNAIHDLAVTDIDADVPVSVTGGGVGAVLGGDEHSYLYLGEVGGGAFLAVIGTVSLIAELRIAVAADGMTGSCIDPCCPCGAKVGSRPRSLRAGIHDILLPLVGALVVLPATGNEGGAGVLVLELLCGHGIELRNERIGLADGTVLGDIAVLRRGVVPALAEGTQKEFGVVGVDGLLVIGNAGVVGLLIKMLTPVLHIRVIVLEDGEIRIGLVGRAGSTVFGGEHFNGTRDESAVVITGIFHAAVVVVQPPEVGTGVRGAVLNHHLAEECRSGISVLLVGVQAREHEVVGDPCGHPVKRCALLLLIGGTATDNGNQAEGQDEGNDEWKELGDGTGK